jgi:hypothetical protein
VRIGSVARVVEMGVLPGAEHTTRYATTVRADPAGTWAALRALRGSDLPLARLLVLLRSGRTRLAGPDAAARPLLDALLGSGFGLLRDEPPVLLVLGTTGRPWRVRDHLSAPADAAGLTAFDRPGHVRIAVSFELEPCGAGRTRLATETRISPVDEAAARSFRRYWRVVRPGSDLVRLDVLRAVRKQAEAG